MKKYLVFPDAHDGITNIPIQPEGVPLIKTGNLITAWLKRFEAQGYYSNANMQRIPLDIIDFIISGEPPQENATKHPLTRQGEAGAEWVSQSEWTGAIYTAIEDICDVDRSDAQGIVDAQAFILAQQWALGTDAITTAKLIDEASRNKTTL